MTSQPNLQESASYTNTHILQQKPSLLKTNIPTKNYILQLPRFFSQEKKTQKIKILQPNKFVTEGKYNNNQKIKNTKKLSKLTLKSSKTQKNETPTKVRYDTKQIKLQKQKVKELLSKGRSMQGTKIKMKRQSQATQIDQMKPKYIDERQKINQDSQNNKHNRINYKIGKQKKKNEKERKIINFVQTEQAYCQNTEIKTSREHKLVTQQAPFSKIKQTINKIDLKNKIENFTQKSELQENKLVKGHQRMFSLFTKPVLKAGKIQRQHIQHLQFIEEVIKKTISQPNNLDFPEVYIVTDKSKFQKAIYNFLQQKQRREYKNFIVYCRITFYLCAHFILLSMNTKVLLGVLGKLAQTQNTLLRIFGVQRQKNRQKFYSQAKMVYNQLPTKQTNIQSVLSIQNQNKNIGRNNQIIKSMIQAIINKKNFPFFQLFISLMVSSTQIQNFQFIAFLDKTLKWQVLKMPTYPFLPDCQTNHQHYLILDLDETLIHFNPQQDLFHIRPYAQVFLKKLSFHFEITIFTAATKEYADDIINEIDKEGNIKHRLYRNHLTFLEGQPIKDISLIGRNLKKTIIIDNLKSNFRLQMDNGIEIKPWLGKGQDNILEKVEIILMKIVNEFSDDLRKGLKVYKNFIQRQIAQNKNCKEKIVFRI